MKKLIVGLIFIFAGALAGLASVSIVVANFKNEYFFQVEPIGDIFSIVKSMYGTDIFWGVGLFLLTLGLFIVFQSLFSKISNGYLRYLLSGIGFLYAGIIMYFTSLTLTLSSMDDMYSELWETMWHRGILPFFIIGAVLLLAGIVLILVGAFLHSDNLFLQKTISGTGLLFAGILMGLLPTAIVANPDRRLSYYPTEFQGSSGAAGYTRLISGMDFCALIGFVLIFFSCFLILQGIYTKKSH